MRGRAEFTEVDMFNLFRIFSSLFSLFSSLFSLLSSLFCLLSSVTSLIFLKSKVETPEFDWSEELPSMIGAARIGHLS